MNTTIVIHKNSYGNVLEVQEFIDRQALMTYFAYMLDIIEPGDTLEFDTAEFQL